MSKVIERGGKGMTYEHEDGFTVYELSVYPESSVLAGQQKRKWVERYATLEAAQLAHPDAELVEGTTYQSPFLGHLPDEDE